MLRASLDVRVGSLALSAEIEGRDGRVTALFGPSGAGKSTALRVVAGVGPLGRSTVTLDETTWTHVGRLLVPPWRRSVGLLTQHPRLFPHLTVQQNLTLVPGVSATSATSLLESLGIGELQQRSPRTLSGGEAHRVALARLLLRQAKVMLLDEPWSSLDRPLAATLAQMVLDRFRREQCAAFLVTHDFSDVERFADHVVVLMQGKVVQRGSPEDLVRRPVDVEVARLVGYVGTVAVGQGRSYGVHPGRLSLGSQPVRGPVVPVVAGRAAFQGGRPVTLAELQDGPTVVLQSQLLPESVTLLDPPTFEVRR